MLEHGATSAPSATPPGAAVVLPSINVAVIPPSASPDRHAGTLGSDEPGASASDLPSAVPTDIDPCQLITADEAGQPRRRDVRGRQGGGDLGPRTDLHVRREHPNVFMVIVAIAPDVATAKAAEKAAEQDLKDNAQSFGVPVNVTKLPDFADQTDAVILDGSASLGGESISGRGMYLLRGTTFVGFNDLVRGKQAPSADDMKAEATTVLSRVP